MDHSDLGQPRAVAEDDLALIDAMHLHPRSSFAQLGQTLGLSPTTVSRHWRGLEERGEAWVSSVPGPAWRFTGALVDIDALPADIDAVSTALAQLPTVVSIHITGGVPAMYALVLTADQSLMEHTVLEAIAHTPGVTAVTPLLMSELFAGRTWSLRALSREQQWRVAPPTPTATDAESLTELDRALFLCLQRDGRMTAQQLAHELGMPEHTIRRRVERLITDGVLAFRTDFVRPAGGWTIQVALSLAVPSDLLREVGNSIATWPETRVCGSVVGDANLFVTVQLHQVQALEPLVARIQQRWPAVSVQRRRLVLRSVKSWGRILQRDGRAASTIAVDPWFSPSPPAPPPPHAPQSA